MMFPSSRRRLPGIQVGEFGDKFRKARESKELSLDDVSNVTKISARMLQAIEEEHFDQLPGGVFNKGFIRAYAKHLGLSSEDAVTDYLACLRQAQIDAHEVWQPERPAAPTAPIHSFVNPAPSKVTSTLVKPDPKPQPPVQVEELPDLQLPRADHVRPRRKDFAENTPIEIPWRLVGLAALILILAFFLWTRRSHAPQAASAKSTPAATSATPTTLTASVQPAPAPPSTSNPAPNNPAPKPAQPSAPVAASPTVKTSAPDPATTPPPTKSAAPRTTAPAATNAGDLEEKVVRKGDVTIRSFGQPAAAPSTKSLASLNLVIRATETSWISVTSDGQLITQETLIAPANTTVHGTHEIVVRVGNAAGVAFLWNGQELAPQGDEAEAKTFVFDHDGMRALSSQAPQ